MTTTIKNITRGCKPAVLITCDCATHADGARSAVLVGPAAVALAARKGKAQSDRIHGFVTLANHPAAMMRKANERDGIFAK